MALGVRPCKELERDFEKVLTGGLDMRLWLLMILFVSLAGALYLGFGTSDYAEKSSELVSQLEDL